jgi:primosomal protein N''
MDYSALQQSVAVLSQHAFSQSAHLSQSAHFVESHLVSQHSVFSQHASAASDFLQQLLHAHEAAANIAATIANDIKILFIVNQI